MDTLLDFRLIEKEWLHHFDDPESDSQPENSLTALADQLRGFVDENQPTQAWQCYDRFLEQANARRNSFEIARVKVICADVQMRIGRPSLARECLADALKRALGHEHDHAVILWLLGIAHWVTPDGSNWEAVANWEESYSCFKALKGAGRQTQEQANWYANRCSEIEQFLKDRRAEGYQKPDGISSSPPGGQTGSQPATGTPPPGPSGLGTDDGNQPSGTSAETSRGTSGGTAFFGDSGVVTKKYSPQGWLEAFPILLGAVSAGEFKQAVEQNPAQFSRALIPYVEINDDLYEVHSLRGAKIVARPGSRTTYLIQVQGDSMDAHIPPINPGDYVMISANIGWNAGDVVVTEILDDTDTPVNNIKLLAKVSKDEIVLKYRSKNPTHNNPAGQDKEFSLRPLKNKETRILGVAIACLKPYHP